MATLYTHASLLSSNIEPRKKQISNLEKKRVWFLQIMAATIILIQFSVKLGLIFESKALAK